MIASNPRIRDWHGKKVWIVGASSGIGASLAKELGKRGATMALSARRQAPLERLLSQAPTGSLAIATDVTERESVQAAFEQILASWGSVDLIIWLAGTYHPMRTANFDLDKAVATVNVNLVGPLNGLSAIIPAVRNKTCHGIAFVSSVAGYRGLPRSLIYGPTKAALTNLTESLYLDLRDRDVGVWVINPGFVETELTAKNDFSMPALITPEQAASEIIRGFESGKFEMHFPKRFTLMLKFLRRLPDRLYFATIDRVTKVRSDG